MNGNFLAGILPFNTAKEAASLDRRPSRPGAFGMMMESISSRRKRPFALVKRGKEVSFIGMPFVDKNGEKISINLDNKNGGTRVSVSKGSIWSRKQADDSQMAFEMHLGGNNGVDRVISEFQKLKLRHLKDTRELRMGILRGAIETPGMKNSAFLKLQNKNAAESVPDGNSRHSRLNTLSSLGSKISNSASRRSASQVNMALPFDKTQKNDDVDQDIELKLQLDKIKKSLPHPLERRIRAFEPPRVDGNGKNIPLKGENDTNLTGRISFTRSEAPLGNPGDENELQRRLLNSLKEGKTTGKTNTAGEKEGAVSNKSTAKTDPVAQHSFPADSEKAVKSDKRRVVDMLRDGWTIRIPRSRKAGGKSSAVKDSQTASGKGKNNNTAEDVKTSVLKDNTAAKINADGMTKSGGETLSAVTQTVSSKGDPGAAMAQTHAGKGDTSSSPSPGADIRNLDEILGKIEGRAKLLSEGGRTTLHIRLRPRELGILMIRIQEQNKQYKISIRADNYESARAIETQLPLIREHLTEAGIQVEKFEVETPTSRSHSKDAANNESFGKGPNANRNGNMSPETPVEEAEYRVPRGLSVGTNTVDFVG